MLQEIFLQTLKNCSPDRIVSDWLTRDASTLYSSRLWLFGVGKAALKMAEGVCNTLKTPIHGGALIIPHATPGASPRSHISILYGSHPYPDASSLASTESFLELAAQCDPQDHVLFLLSGGASALLCKPANGVSLEEKVQKTKDMMASGASIHELNAARKKLSAVKGGKLQKYFKCPVTVLVLSDVCDNDLATIGSGPLWTPLSNDDAKVRFAHFIVADGLRLAREAARVAQAMGYENIILEEKPVQEDVEQCAQIYADRILKADRRSLLIRYGEPMVRLGSKTGMGGRSQQLALLLVQKLAGKRPVSKWSFLAAGSDGIDGNSDAAGAVVTDETYAKLMLQGLNMEAALEGRNAYPLLKELNALVLTGLTGNNLQDLHLLNML